MKEFDDYKHSKNIEKKLQSNLSKNEMTNKSSKYYPICNPHETTF